MPIFFENCFGCLRLRTGVLIIGYLHLIATLVILAVNIIKLVTFYVSHPLPMRDHEVNVMSALLGCILSYMVPTILLIYGATKGNRHFMMPFTAVVAFECVCASSFEIISCLFLVSTLLNSFILFIYVGLYIFALTIVLSHHQELKKFTLHNREDDEVSIVNPA